MAVNIYKKKKVNVNAVRYIRYESFFSYLCKKRRMKHIIHSETKTLIHNNS